MKRFRKKTFRKLSEGREEGEKVVSGVPGRKQSLSNTGLDPCLLLLCSEDGGEAQDSCGFEPGLWP